MTANEARDLAISRQKTTDSADAEFNELLSKIKEAALGGKFSILWVISEADPGVPIFIKRLEVLSFKVMRLPYSATNFHITW